MVHDFAEFSYAVGEVRKAIAVAGTGERIPRWVIPMAESLADTLEHIGDTPDYVQTAVQSCSWYYSAAEAAVDLRYVVALARSEHPSPQFSTLHQFLGMWRDAVKKNQPLQPFSPGGFGS